MLPDRVAFAELAAAKQPRRADPRWFQIASLSALLAFGLSQRAFSIAPLEMATIFVSAIATQWGMSSVLSIRFEAKSALITSLSLTLLLRANELWPLAAAAFIAIASKFLIRAGGKHLFNPANIGIVATTLATDAAWTTPGQWGTALWLAALMAGAGSFVTYRASRLDTPLVFLAAFSAMIIARALWLGDPMSIPLNRLQNGALILFAFFMISDPKTTPDGLISRAIFTTATAALAYVLIYHFHQSDGLFSALAIACLARPALDAADQARRRRRIDPHGTDEFIRKRSNRAAPAE